MIKYGNDEPIEDQPVNLISNPFLYNLIHTIPFGSISIVNIVESIHLCNHQFEQNPPFLKVHQNEIEENDSSVLSEQVIDELIPEGGQSLLEEKKQHKEEEIIHSGIHNENEETPSLMIPIQQQSEEVVRDDSIINDSAAIDFSARSFSHTIIPTPKPIEEMSDSIDYEMVTQPQNWKVEVKSENQRNNVQMNIMEDSEPFPLTQPSAIPLVEQLHSNSLHNEGKRKTARNCKSRLSPIKKRSNINNTRIKQCEIV